MPHRVLNPEAVVMTAAFEAALCKLELVDRHDRAAIAIAKLIVSGARALVHLSLRCLISQEGEALGRREGQHCQNLQCPCEKRVALDGVAREVAAEIEMRDTVRA